MLITQELFGHITPFQGIANVRTTIINNRAYNQLDFYSFDVDDGGVG
ncbi:Uncharacterised protein [Vibrio cholerae]|uniref:Uncharacterized protein n=1 Tax=Vibrio cholerae TaxID=666 RepID=A0A655Q075_VIBCL|nr:Uncharacterised protein [Vibrio cholerae]CSB34310.1 Uncharacterised protein [Vibrio cholerae]CSB98882.1 Uncharacterised protein [Vibrio cholerae]CSC33664.1 Uncharacterised protein [Vibrio cholerae]CSC90424.1 Uncharacterised protein [Vibrio cholerae]